MKAPAPTLAVLLLSATVIALPARAAERLAVSITGDSQLAARVLLSPSAARVSWPEAHVMWVEGCPPAPVWTQLLERVRQGAGLVLALGPCLPDLAPLGLAAPRQVEERGSLSLTAAGEQRHRYLSREVVWPTAPQVGRRWLLELRPGAPLEAVVVEQASGRPVLLAGRLGRGRVAVLSLQLTDLSNRELLLWPYFNYLLHVLSYRAAGQVPDRYADWPASPVPGSLALRWLLVGLALAWALTCSLFRFVRRYSKRHPELIERFFATTTTTSSPRQDADAGWRQIGFTRSLAGFLTLVGTLFLLFAPFYYVTNILVPNSVQPFPQAKGIWEFAWEALQIAWFIFDAGTFVAFVKYFAEFRIKEPAEALRSAQFFVWWQILTGLVQVTMASIVAVIFLPHTRYGYSSTFVILIALGQYPGCFGVITFFFQASQRFDCNIALDLLSDWVLRFGLMIPCVLFFRAWGVAHPAYGEALGAAIGIGVGYYLSTLVTFGLGLLLYKRLGLQLTPLFLAHFDLRTALRMLRFGLSVVLGQAFFRAAKTIDRVVISLLLINYTEWLGIEGQINTNLMFLFPVAYRFFETAMAAFSESHSNGKTRLTQYYLVRFFQVGFLYTAIGISLFWALGPSFVRLVMDPQWARAADYMGIAAVIGVFYAPAWISDMLQKGADRPGLFAIVLGVEQALRIGLFFLLIPRYQFWGFYWALLITITIKVLGAWLINHLVIVKLRVYWYQMLIAPTLAGLLNFALLRVANHLLAPTARLEMMLLFFSASLASFLVCFFALGLVGGMDRALAGELEQASRMTGPLRVLTRLFYWAARAGWSLSPLHDRFPVALQAAALEEARALEQQRDR